MKNDEMSIVKWLTEHVETSPAVRIGIGDDMAVVDLSSSQVLVSTDMLLDGVHFDSAKHDPGAIGRKAVFCVLSDCAAMAVRPIALTISVALSSSLQENDIHELFTGMVEAARQFECAVVGGDTTRWKHPLAIDIAVTAVPFDGIEPITRSPASTGDTLYVTGPLGGSLLGRHMNFTPRIQEAKCLAELLGSRLHAMIDLSDGLSLDLWRICSSSGTGAILDERLIQATISDDAHRMSQQDGRSAMDHVLSDGEDYELLLAVDGAIESAAMPVYEIGQIVDGSDIKLHHEDGSTECIQPRGFLH